MKRGLSRVYLWSVVALLVATASYGLWCWLRPRTIGVCVVTDYSFRQQRPDWRGFLDTRFQEVNRIFDGTGVRWAFRHDEEPDPTGNLHGMENRRQKLIRAECEADIVLGVTAQPESRAAGDVPPFSHTAVVAYSAAEPATRNTLVIARALAAIFGAPTDKSGAGTLMTQPPESATVPKPVASLIRRLRWYDFAKGTAALQGPWGSRAYDALVSVWSGRASNPPREAHRVLGLSLATDEIYPPAIAHLSEVVKLDPDNAEAHTALANLYSHNFQTAEAIAEYRAAIRLTPTNAANHAGLAVALANGGLGQDALDEFREALRISPRFAVAQAGLAYVLSQQLGQIDEAIAAYGVALEMDPELVTAMEGLERTKTIKQRSLAAAIEQRKRAQESPLNADAHFDLALSEARAGNVDVAVKEFRRSIELDHANGRAHANLAILLCLRKDYTAALQESQRAREAGFEPPLSLIAVLKRKTGE